MRYWLLCFVLVAGCMGSTPTGGAVLGFDIESGVVQAGDIVEVEYVGSFLDGEIFDSGTIEVLVGSGQVIAGFDKALVGMIVGEEKRVELPPKDAYGEYRADLVVDVPRADLENEGIVIVEGMTVLVGGRVGRIVEIGDDNVAIDVNHYLAGKSLVFGLKVLDIG